MNTTATRPTHLRRLMELTGQIQPWGDDQGRFSAKYELVTEGGKNYRIVFDSRWFTALFKNMWNYVSIIGTVDFHDKTITISKLKPIDLGFNEIDEVVDLYEQFHDPADWLQVSESARQGKILNTGL